MFPSLSPSPLLDKPTDDDRLVDVVVLAGLEGHGNRAVDHVERPVPLHLAGIAAQLAAQPITTISDLYAVAYYDNYEPNYAFTGRWRGSTRSGQRSARSSSSTCPS